MLPVYIPSAVVLFTLAYFFTGGPVFIDKNLIVNTEYGPVQAKTLVTRGGKNYYQFYGVRYGAPPVGNKRFEPPEKPEKWTDIHFSNRHAPACAQYHMFLLRVVGTEDCLSLDIATPQIEKDGKVHENLLPVIVNIHGGIFHIGNPSYAAHYGAEYLVDEDVVVVSVRYRLGVLGFFNDGTGIVKGNMGLKDQTLALKWVQENIAKFGGDKNRVTISGQSAGGVSAHMHQFSPLSKGLFHRIISFSGNAFDGWSLRRSPLEQAKYFSAKFNCSRDNSEEMVECLRSVETDDLMRGHIELGIMSYNPLALFGPTVETFHDSNTFLPDYPETLLKQGKFNRVDMLNGVNNKEGLLFAGILLKNETLRKSINKNPEAWLGNYMAPLLKLKENDPSLVGIVEKLKEFYFKEKYKKGEDVFTLENFDEVVNLISDTCFVRGIYTYQKLFRAENQDKNSNLYLYYYTYPGSFRFGEISMNMLRNIPPLEDLVQSGLRHWIKHKFLGIESKHPGNSHVDELPLIYKLTMQPMLKEGKRDYGVSKALTTAIASFARDGKPKAQNNTEWLPISNVRNLRYMQIDRNWTMIEDPFKTHMNFWNTL